MAVYYCSECVYCSVAATPVAFDEHGVCSGCRIAREKRRIDWNRRLSMLRALTDEYRSSTNYDILIPVSGGKDSYFQVHIASEVLGLRPLLVTYHGNNYLREGEYNLQRMRDVFRCDHLIIRPGSDVLVKMNRLGFRLQGDMNWHNHCGIFTAPIQVAVRSTVSSTASADTTGSISRTTASTPWAGPNSKRDFALAMSRGPSTRPTTRSTPLASAGSTSATTSTGMATTTRSS
jgi:hypothetical protein